MADRDGEPRRRPAAGVDAAAVRLSRLAPGGADAYDLDPFRPAASDDLLAAERRFWD